MRASGRGSAGLWRSTALAGLLATAALPAHALAAVVRPQRKRISTASDPWIFPIEFMGTRLIAHPVALGIPEGPRLEAHNIEAAPSEALQQNAPRGADSDNDVVHFILLRKLPHGHMDML